MYTIQNKTRTLGLIICDMASRQRLTLSRCESQTSLWASGALSFSVLILVTHTAKSLHLVITFQLFPHCLPGRKSQGVADLLGVAVMLHQREQLSLNVYILFSTSAGLSQVLRNPEQFWWVFSGLRVPFLLLGLLCCVQVLLLLKPLQWSHQGDLFEDRLRRRICLDWWTMLWVFFRYPIVVKCGVCFMYQIRNELLGAGLSTMVQVRTYSKNSIWTENQVLCDLSV